MTGEHYDKEWLVEIVLKDWEPDLPGKNRIVTFEEVIAPNEYYARHIAFDQFESRCGYDPIMRRKMQQWGITPYNCCAGATVLID